MAIPLLNSDGFLPPRTHTCSRPEIDGSFVTGEAQPNDIAMIAKINKLDQAFEQMHELYKALSALRADVLPRDPKLFALLAEGPLSQIRQLQREIDEYTGVDVVRKIAAAETGDYVPRSE